jgi:hypothetical protein
MDGPLTVENAALPTGRIYLGVNEIRPEDNPVTTPSAPTDEVHAET